VEESGMTDLQQIIASVGATTAVLLVIAVLAKDYLKSWIENASRHAYDVELEGVKADFQRQTGQALEQLRVHNEQQLRTEAAIVTSAAAGQSAAFAQRLNAIQQLWVAMLKLRDDRSNAVTLTEWMTDREMVDRFDDPKFRSSFAELETRIAEDMRVSQQAEQHRMLSGEHLWSLFWSFRFLVGRVAMIIQMKMRGHYPRDRDWRTDDAIVAVASQLLTADELPKFKSRQVGGLLELLMVIESTYVAAATSLLSGEQTATEMAETTRRLREALQRVTDPKTGRE
jgi:hypothetical protein